MPIGANGEKVKMSGLTAEGEEEGVSRRIL